MGGYVVSAESKTHEALLSDWKENARRQYEENYEFLRSLKQKSSKKVDRLALELHREAFSIVDCTKCANCCRTLRPVFSDEDIDRIAGHLGMVRDEFIAAYLERDEEQDRLANPRLCGRVSSRRLTRMVRASFFVDTAFSGMKTNRGSRHI
jgi:hypothetical protein